MRTSAPVLSLLFSFSGDVHVGHDGFSAVKQPITGTHPDVPVPRNMSSSADGSVCIAVSALCCDVAGIIAGRVGLAPRGLESGLAVGAVASGTLEALSEDSIA